ncbi:rab-interacting lysosomal protein isoform X1 [Sorex fumeus]|uniref:rab-interacting lysosomal protein isoform X1 n=1 Tax=Sorex fumeus TaxID=62283 RepID=UPI0024ADA42F|nr:rab-interacting lysosomal protein isoform X1 [Sorex fumeus]
MEPRPEAPGAQGWGPRGAAAAGRGTGTAAELVYHLAGALGTELQELARRCGPEAAAGLVPLVVRALELLEKAAVGPSPDSVSAQQAELELRRLREENEQLRAQLLAGPQEERALLRRLKEVTDRQRDELRAHNRDLLQRSQETEALQEQLQRLLLVNAELRHKLAAVETQLRSARDRERERQPVPEPAREPGLESAGTGPSGSPDAPVGASQQPGSSSKAEPCTGFSREEVEQILKERNELKANVFLLKEELAYFQRELLTDARVPGLLLEAMKVAVRKQRKKIKAKMLGTPEEVESSDDEDGSWLLISGDKEDPPAPESRIQNFFGLWYRGTAEAPEAETSSTASCAQGAEEEASQSTTLVSGGSPASPNS